MSFYIGVVVGVSIAGTLATIWHRHKNQHTNQAEANLRNVEQFDRELGQILGKAFNENALTKTYTMTWDERFERTLNCLQTLTEKMTKAEVFRRGIALLKIAVDGRNRRLRLALIDKDGKVINEITGI